MPRYSILLSSSNDPRRRRSFYAWASDLDAAKNIARGRLRVMREVAWDHNQWNRWTVSEKLSPHREPEVVASGGPED